jgi:2-aminoadipate transaminase
MPEKTPSNSAKLVLSVKARRTQEAPISALIAAAVANPDLISLAAGLVDPLTLPVEECAEITKRLFADRARGQSVLQYDTTLGLEPLRHQVLAHVEALEGVPAASFGVGADDVVITTGSQQALYLIGDVMLDPGDIVIAANPSYFVFTGTLQSLGAKVLPVPVDEEGMDVEAVARLLDRLEREGQIDRVKFVYVTSFFDNPTGLTLSLKRRQRLLQIVRQYSRHRRILILEDAAYRELRYDGGEALPSIKSFDEANEYTILTQTFSKPFAPGIKLGYTIMPKGLLDPVLRQKGNHDFGSANLSQHIALETMRDGSYVRHLEVLKDGYRRKRDRMLAALQQHMPATQAIQWTRPRGGLYVWVTLPEWMDASREGRLFAKAVERGVLYVPGDYSFQPDERGFIPKNHMRLSFGHVHPDRIDRGIARLAEAVREEIEQRGPASHADATMARATPAAPAAGAAS